MIERPSTDALAVPTTPAEDRRLIDRCLGGDQAAWDLLYHTFHQTLLTSIRRMLGVDRADPNLVDEIAARVWYSAISADGRLLDRFDAAQNCRLSTFLSAIARGQAVAIFRSEKRRRNREAVVSRLEGQLAEESHAQTLAQLDEFLRTLTHGECEFFHRVLLAQANDTRESDYSQTNVWQLSCRIRAKLRKFTCEESQ